MGRQKGEEKERVQLGAFTQRHKRTTPAALDSLTAAQSFCEAPRWVVLSPFTRHLGSLTAANWVSVDFNVSYSSC